MEDVISKLVNRYDRGLVTRRELIQGLALLAGAGAAGNAAAAVASPFQVNSIDHVSLQAKDVERTANFYKEVFGLPLLDEDKKTKTIRLKVGTSRIAIRQVEPHGVLDHFGFGVAKFDKASAIENLKQMGVPPLDTGEPIQFHVMDPDGYPVQIVSRER